MKERVLAFVDHEIGFRLTQKLIRAHNEGEIELIAVVTTLENDQKWWPSVCGICNEASIPIHRYPAEIESIISSYEPDLIFLLSWKYVVPPEIYKLSKVATINLHYSLLPKYRGVYPVNWALINDEKETGVTYHFVDRAIDSGEIICQERQKISADDTARSLQLKLDNVAYDLFDVVWKCLNYAAPPHIIGDLQSSYKSREDFEHIREIDIDKTYKASELINIMRGCTFFPDSKQLYYINPQTGKRVYLSLVIEERN